MPPAFVHRITEYDPADRDAHGHYIGAEDTVSDHGPVEAAYLAAIAAFAEASDIDRWEIREPAVAGFVHFGGEPPVEGHGLDGLFPPDLTGYHDGAEVPLPVALQLVRIMLRDQGAWCRLESGDRFTLHVGWDQYVYVGSDRPCTEVVARTRELGLFPERLTASPCAAEADEVEVNEAADEHFWMRVRTALAARRALLFEEGRVRNAVRWHRITQENLDTVRAGLGPRALLTVWPDLTPDVDAVLAALPQGESIEFVWEARDGTISHAIVDDTGSPALSAHVADARAAPPCPCPPPKASRCSVLPSRTATACCVPGGDSARTPRVPTGAGGEGVPQGNQVRRAGRADRGSRSPRRSGRTEAAMRRAGGEPVAPLVGIGREALDVVQMSGAVGAVTASGRLVFDPSVGRAADARCTAISWRQISFVRTIGLAFAFMCTARSGTVPREVVARESVPRSCPHARRSDGGTRPHRRSGPPGPADGVRPSRLAPAPC